MEFNWNWKQLVIAVVSAILGWFTTVVAPGANQVFSKSPIVKVPGK